MHLEQPHNCPFDVDVVREDMATMLGALGRIDQLREAAIYITGATGMIASYLIYFLLYLNEEQGFRINIYANARSSEKIKKRFGVFSEKPYFKFVKADVNEPFPSGINVDYIIHAASLASPQHYGSNPVETMLPNTIGTWRLLEAAKALPLESFLFFSSSAVYGDSEDTAPLDESSLTFLDFTMQGNFYGVSKRCGEALGRAYHAEYDVPFKSARIFHSYGPTMDVVHDKRLFSEFTRNIIECKDLEIRSDGLAVRSFCYLSDAVIGLLLILLYGEDGQSYNVGNPRQTYTVLDLASKLTAAFRDRGISVSMQNNQQSEHGYLAIPKKHVSPFSIDKLEQLGFAPTVGVEEGFKRTVRALEAIREIRS